MAQTAHARTVDALLKEQGVTLEEFIAVRRDTGMSYARIARALYEFTVGVVDVTSQTINNWSSEFQQEAQAS